MSNEPINFRFSLRHGTSKPAMDQLEVWEPFVYGPDSNGNYRFCVKVPNPDYDPNAASGINSRQYRCDFYILEYSQSASQNGW